MVIALIEQPICAEMVSVKYLIEYQIFDFHRKPLDVAARKVAGGAG